MSYLYPVLVEWIPGLPQKPYRGGIGQWEGVVMHQTENLSGDSARSEREYELTHFNQAFVHEFIDSKEIIQVANPDFLAYGAGAVANPRFIHLELCSVNTAQDFAISFDMWCQRAAFFLSLLKLGVVPAMVDGSGTLWAHADVTRFLGGTGHEDPIAYLQQWGKSWQNVLDTVQHHYDILVKGDDPMLSVEDANKIIQFLSAAYNCTAIVEAQAEFHRLANELRKASGQPEQ